MKRNVFMLILFIALLLSSCSSGDNSDAITWSTDAAGNKLLLTNSSDTVMPDALPADVTYNDTHISVTKLEAYQNCPSYRYTLFLVITLDVSALSDSELHWLFESDMSVTSYLTNDANGQDFDSMPKLGTLLLADGETVQVVLTSSFFDENRYDFGGSEVTINVSITQEDTYEYTNSDGDVVDLNRHYDLQYTVTLPEKLPEAETIPEPLYGYVADWLAEHSNNLVP